MSLPDSGKREKFETGAVRDTQEGKGRYDLISPYGLHRLAVHYESGAGKYDDRNWEKGIPVSRCISSARRHINYYMEGSEEEDHLAAAAWNLFAAMHFEEAMPEMQDIPTRKKQEKCDQCGTAHEKIISLSEFPNVRVCVDCLRK